MKNVYYILFCISCFVLALSMRIEGGMCNTSPCNSLNESYMDEQIFDDYTIESASNLIFNPTFLLLPSILRSVDYEVETYYSNIFAQLLLDQSDNTKQYSTDQNHLVETDDASSLRKAYWLMTGITLVNIPLWLFYGWLVKNMWLRLQAAAQSHAVIARIGQAIFLLLLFAAIIYTVFLLYLLAPIGGGSIHATWEIITFQM